MDELMERMAEAVQAMEATLERLQAREVTLAATAQERVERIVAEVEGVREAELQERLRNAEAKLAEAESRIAELAAEAETAHAGAGRKTAAAGLVSTLGKQGIAASVLQSLEGGRVETGSLDTALASLSIEQRFAVKAEMLRSGLLNQ